MRYLKKWYVILLLVFVAEVGFESCARHYRYKRMVKRRRSAIAGHYRGTYHKKVRKNTIPINQNFIIKNKRNTRGVPTGSRRW